MGRGGQGSQKPKLPWSEIERHNSRDDRWIVIGGEVYDVTSWSYKHPGGSRLIGHYAGQDATVSFKQGDNFVVVRVLCCTTV
jgi:fatty acid desaturase 2 (delta-6 desaturase)